MGSIYLPDPIVEVAFGFGPYDEPDDADWTDITDDVFEVAIQRGRSSEFDEFQASTATVSVYNDDRKYDPLNLSGPYLTTESNGRAPYIVTQNTKSGTSLGSNNAQNMPSGITAGDLLIAICSQQNPGGTAITASVGWTDINQQQQGSTTVRAAVFAKIAAGSDTLSLSGASQDFATVVMRIANHKVTNVSTDITISALLAALGGGVRGVYCPTATIPAGESDLILWSSGCDFNAPYDPYIPIGSDEVARVISAASTATMLMVAQRPVLNKDSETSTSYGGIAIDSGSFSSSNFVNYVSFTLVIPGADQTVTQLQPNLPIRVLADLGSDGIVPVWRGVVDGWPGTYSEGGYRNTVEIPCTDAFKVLAERPIPDTFVNDMTDFTLPYTWYRMDTAKQGFISDSLSDKHKFFPWQPVEAVEGLVPVSENALKLQARSLKSAQSEHFGIVMPVTTGTVYPSTVRTDDILAGIQWSVSFVVQYDGRGSWANGTLFSIFGPGRIGFSWGGIHIDSAGTLSMTVITNTATITVTASNDVAIDMLDGRPHHVVGVRNSQLTASLYVDGVPYGAVTNVSTGTHYDLTNGFYYIGCWRPDSTGDPYDWPGMIIDELMTFPHRALSTAQVATLHDILTVGFSELRSTGTVINDILDLVGWPASLRAIDDGEIVMRPPANPGGVSALEIMQAVAATEQGRLFVDSEGKITFHANGRFLRETVENTVQYEFTDTGLDVGTLDGSLQVTLDDRFTFDGARVTRVNGYEQSASVRTNPVRTRSLSDLYFSTDSQSQNLAESIVFRYGKALPRSEAWDIDCEVEPDDWLDILSLEIGHRIKHSVSPGGGGSAIALEQHVELIEHDITPERWVITMNGSPVDNNDYFLWDTTATADNIHGWAKGAWG